MEVLTIKVKDDKTLKLIHELEDMNLLEVVHAKTNTTKTKLSDLLKGSITTEQADNMQKELKQMRSEWERDTY